LTAPPGLSRPPTSFIGPWYQGIHRPPLPTYPTPQHTPTDEPQTPRCSRPLCKSQPTTNPQPRTTNHHTRQPTAAHSHAWHQDNNHRLFSQNPNRVLTALPLARPAHRSPPTPLARGCTPTLTGRHAGSYQMRRPPHGRTGQCLRPRATGRPRTGRPGLSCRPPRGREALLRKEVIQPHLPVRLPCYDFVPIASPTFDGSPPCGLGHRLRVLPTFVT
jgi:hypothetical protein